MAKTVEIKITENEERNGKKEQVLETLYNSTHRIMHELGLNREETLKTRTEPVSTDQKLKGIGAET